MHRILVPGMSPVARMVLEHCSRHSPGCADPNRCDRAFVGNTIGQANAVSDRVLDLRECVVAGKNLKGLTLSGALLVGADL